MKPTDEERREVAENLRNMCGCGCRYAEEFYELLNDTVMRAWDFHDFHDVADRLADLIEPEERTCRIRLTDTIDTLGQRMYQCSSCGYLTEVEVCFSDDGVEIECFSFCPHCGAKVVSI